MRGLGCERQVISADEAVRIEPALAHIRPQLAGATFTAEDESGDANQFTRELAALCEAAACSSAWATTSPRCAKWAAASTMWN
jgi:D-amino-acid dehydrogenase